MDREWPHGALAGNPVRACGHQRGRARCRAHRVHPARTRRHIHDGPTVDVGARDAAVRLSIPVDVFPSFKPPFTESRVLVSPAGEVWIPRAGRADAQWILIDVVGRDGQLRRQVRLPAGRQIVGFGTTARYIAARDEFDLYWLERVPLAR